jgi:uncharacterized LabA/DUF88 family protein
MDEVQTTSHRIAVLIDADNTSADLVEPLLKEVAKYGVAHVKRVYGDWTDSRLTKWKDKLNKFAIQPIQQFAYTKGKNATDSALIIDAMDLLYTGNFDGFCIVSSDSDFTRLASRIRESGLVVYGFGENKTPEAFISACDKFIYTEILKQAESSDAQSDATANDDKHRSPYGGLSSSKPSTSSQSVTNSSIKGNRTLVKLLKDAFEAIANEEEWVHLGPFGTQLTKLSPSFDPRNYGYKKLSDLVIDTNLFEVKKASKSVRIKLKN